MKIIKICQGGCGHKPAVWLDGGIHAREWISPAVTTYAINELTSKSEEYAKLLENLDWYILPAHNPDGYNFTMEHVNKLLLQHIYHSTFKLFAFGTRSTI